MILNKKNGIAYYTFPNLSSQPGLVHGIFTRKGGSSTGPYQGLNVSYDVGDENEHVQKNRETISQVFGGKGILSLKQVHGTDSIMVKKEDDTISADKPDDVLCGDAFISNSNQMLFMIKVADCQPVMLYDPKQQVMANIHSGWRGSMQNIIGHTISAMQKTFNCRSADLMAGVGPSLGPCCAEFIHYKEEIPEAYWKYKLRDNHFDLWAVSKDQLCNAGVMPENISMSRMCTKCSTDQFFSYRGDETTGRFGAVMGLV